jgi:hypothetical protein
MGADNVIVCYGIRYSLGADGSLPEELIESLEAGTESRLVAARSARLRAYWGRVTDGGEYFLLIGQVLGTFGVQGAAALTVSDEQFASLVADTKRRLHSAGLTGEPGLHVQLEAQY